MRLAQVTTTRSMRMQGRVRDEELIENICEIVRLLSTDHWPFQVSMPHIPLSTVVVAEMHFVRGPCEEVRITTVKLPFTFLRCH